MIVTPASEPPNPHNVTTLPGLADPAGADAPSGESSIRLLGRILARRWLLERRPPGRSDSPGVRIDAAIDVGGGGPATRAPR